MLPVFPTFTHYLDFHTLVRRNFKMPAIDTTLLQLELGLGLGGWYFRLYARILEKLVNDCITTDARQPQ